MFDSYLYNYMYRRAHGRPSVFNDIVITIRFYYDLESKFVW